MPLTDDRLQAAGYGQPATRRWATGCRLQPTGCKAARLQGRPQATVQLDVHFIDAVQVGEFVECRAKVVRRTRSLVFMAAELVVGERVVATANGVWKTLGKR